ncbi:GIY-YIG catalytic domain protein [Aeromicrobium marinum DSM 15272]|uniref:GIY-YIG catalytic domain protein n=1 Tax=Aeromicrobium marinum DSM 15272 TaxID=585531 RepID=E2SAM6_9ACTN|nr:DEDD exonuclease domain-containing protein [Aeromicrobium marinum]EFQ83422.1 GIY-YIG catalytic domain protein [Aeromicrobium marinum DSM 15272]
MDQQRAEQAWGQGSFGQGSFDDLGRLLVDVTFCVVDLETTGGSPQKGSRITEIGAVLVRGGEVLGEFQTLVNPDESIPAFITVLTGITDQMVVQAPRIAEALPSFLEFARGSVLVAHNAPFDTGFLRHAAAELQIPWPRFEVLDTALLARRVLLAGEVRNCKLGTLAAHVGATTTPNHRALSDARATVDVLHHLFERLGPLGVHSLEEARAYTSTVTPAQRRKRHLADKVPNAAGVYLFRDRADDVLYVGTSADLRRRVRTYFTRSETRSRMGEMVMLAERIETVVCATALEARVRELRLIAHHRPPYNRRSKDPARTTWVKLTQEPWPRISLVPQVRDDGADYIGPFRSRAEAVEATHAVHDTFAIRQCTDRMGRTSRRSPCVLAEMDRCLSPCDGSADPEVYAIEVGRVRSALTADPVEVVDRIGDRMRDLAADERFEDAALWRDRLQALVRGADRTHRLRELTAEPEIVAAAPHADGWEMHVVRHGRLAAAGVLPRGTEYRGWLDVLLATAETVTPGPGPAPAALVEETEVIRRWLTGDGVRLVDGTWVTPLASAARHLPPPPRWP